MNDAVTQQPAVQDKERGIDLNIPLFTGGKPGAVGEDIVFFGEWLLQFKSQLFGELNVDLA